MPEATRTLHAVRAAALVGDFDRSPAYAGLADALTVLIGDGRIPDGVRLPSERDLTAALGVSRTTVTRAYAILRDTGYAEARHGSGTYTRVPGDRSRVLDRALTPRRDRHDSDLIDLACAATSAPPGIAAAYAEAASQLPAYLGGIGYYPAGLPDLQEAVAAHYASRGLPTDPEQIVVTPGALSAAAIVARALSGPRDRVLVESPVYPNAVRAITNGGARAAAAAVDPAGWDLDVVAAALDDVRPSLAYLIPDFQNPTGHLMTDAERERYAGLVRRAGVVPIVDEAHAALALDGQAMPLPFAAHAPATVTIGSASKMFWGGLRMGWIRAPHARVDELVQARSGLDLGAPVLEQLVLAHLLADPAPVMAAHLDRLREQRDTLLAALDEHLPTWQYHRPGGGLAVWCRLPAANATAVAIAAEARGLIVTPGPVFAVEGGLDRFIRIPWTGRSDILSTAVERLAEADAATSSRSTPTPRPSRVLVA